MGLTNILTPLNKAVEGTETEVEAKDKVMEPSDPILDDDFGE